MLEVKAITTGLDVVKMEKARYSYRTWQENLYESQNINGG